MKIVQTLYNKNFSFYQKNLSRLYDNNEQQMTQIKLKIPTLVIKKGLKFLLVNDPAQL
jgi:hypothetical protein